MLSYNNREGEEREQTDKAVIPTPTEEAVAIRTRIDDVIDICTPYASSAQLAALTAGAQQLSIQSATTLYNRLDLIELRRGHLTKDDVDFALL